MCGIYEKKNTILYGTVGFWKVCGICGKLSTKIDLAIKKSEISILTINNAKLYPLLTAVRKN